ncbi:MAG: YkgJ family cysteine cluster protein [Deltaproteobacteria bacterium]
MIRQFIPEEFCLKCQGCCRFHDTESIWSPNLLDTDIVGLLENKILPFFILGSKKLRLSWNQEQDSFTCSLLDISNNNCRAYSFRPFECQLYPFLINRRGNRVFLAVDLKCPFAEGNRESRHFKEYTRYLTDFFDSPELKKVLKENPQIIQEYAQVVDLFPLNI